MKYIDAEKLIAEIERRIEICKRVVDDERNKEDMRRYYRGKVVALEEILYPVASLPQEQIDMGEVSDGYHTFNELYYYRMLYNAAFFNLLPKGWVHKSKRHHTGEECFGGGWFIVMANLPTGQVSNHYELKDWDLFKVTEKEIADEFDGHTPQEAAERIKKYLQLPDTLEDKIKRATESWKGVDVDEFMDEVRGREQEQTEVGKPEYGPYARQYPKSEVSKEQPVVDLDLRTFAQEMDSIYALPSSETKNTEEEPLNWEYAIARHFYELGQRT